MALCEVAVVAICSTAAGIAPTSTVLSLDRSKAHQNPQRTGRGALRKETKFPIESTSRRSQREMWPGSRAAIQAP